MIKKIAYCAKIALLRRQSLRRWRELLRNETASCEQRREAEETARRSVVLRAMAHTRFYSRFYADAGLEPGDIGKPGWFEALPVLTKDGLREHFDDLADDRQRGHLKYMTTGGSTGVPVRTGYDARIPEEVYSWRMQSWFGVHPWDDHAYVWRDTRKTSSAKFLNALMWWPTRHLKLDASVMDEDGMLKFVGDFNKLKPTMLYGYVGALAQLAKAIADLGLEVHSPKFVCTTSAPLPPSHRAAIGKAFNAPVVDQYGSCEVRWIAQQCPECGGLHVNSEHVSVEFVGDGNRPVPEGTFGRTLLTNLEDTAFPLIRYENGDRGRWLGRPCPCGRTLPLVDSVKGRESECFALPGGKTVSGEFLTTIFDAEPELVSGFRVVQHPDLSMTIEYVPSADEGRIVRFLEKATEGLRRDAAVDFRKVAEIAHDRGKLRFVVRERQ